MRILALFLTLLFSSPLLYAQVFEVETIKDAGPNEERINFVILPDGYTESEMGKFRDDAQFLADRIFQNALFEQYADFINMHIILVPSNESGASHAGTAVDEPGDHPVKIVNNYFGSRFDVGGVHRLLVPSNNFKISSVLADNFPNYDQVFMLVNSPYYGGSGGQYATASIGSNAVEVAIHEIGHSFANLADEYEYAGSTPREAPNATQETNRELIRWNIWIDESTPLPTPEVIENKDLVGLFEGAVYRPTDWYRPKLNCKMRSLGQPFCEVCAETFVRRFYDLINPLTKVSPEDNYTVNGVESVEFVADILGLGDVKYDLNWKLNGEELDIQSDRLTLEFNDNENNENIIELIVTDTSGLVRQEVFQFSTQWTVYGFLEGQPYVPEITSFEPATASGGEIVTISGLNFNESAETVSVDINGLPLEISEFVDNQVLVLIPDNQFSGFFRLVIDGEETVAEEEFKTKPAISDFEPKAAEVGELVTVFGTNFSDVVEENEILMGGKIFNPVSATSTQLEFIIPESAVTERFRIIVNEVTVVSSTPLEILIVTGLPDDPNQNSISVYPNPTSGYVKILIPSKLSGDIDLGIYSLRGEEVMKIDPAQQEVLDLSSLAKGLYLLKVRAEDKVVTKKILVE